MINILQDSCDWHCTWVLWSTLYRIAVIDSVQDRCDQHCTGLLGLTLYIIVVIDIVQGLCSSDWQLNGNYSNHFTNIQLLQIRHTEQIDAKRCNGNLKRKNDFFMRVFLDIHKSPTHLKLQICSSYFSLFWISETMMWLVVKTNALTNRIFIALACELMLI